MKHWFGNALRGICMGLADVVPGVSGGTVALILGIYPRLVNAVGGLGAGMLRRIRTPAFRALLRQGLRHPARLADDRSGRDAGHVLLLASVAAGIVPAIAVGAHTIPPLLDSHPAQLRGLFLGLVAASVIIPFREIGRRTPSRWLLALGAALVAAWVAGLPEPTTRHARGVVSLELAAPQAAEVRLTPANLTLVAPGEDDLPDIAYGLATSVIIPAGAASAEIEVVARMAGDAANVPPGSIRGVEGEGPLVISAVSQPAALTGGRDPSLGYVFLGGALAISAMTLPGLSGAFVLLLLGLYHYVLHSLALAVSHGDPGAAAVVVTMVAAMGTGLLTFARVLKYLFSRWRDGTLAVLVGLMAGSLRKLWPFVDHPGHGREVLTLPAAGDPGTVSVALMFAAGVALVVLMHTAGRRIRTQPFTDRRS
ncbi:MAG: DUF368 domain-containing protein [Gemmatimonadetes bacterium]|nr:DUF368 domain-containing protein [Gemmatimonadota bacterium]